MKIDWNHINDFEIGDTILNKYYKTVCIKKYNKNFVYALPEDWNQSKRNPLSISDLYKYCSYKILLIEKFDKNKIKFDFTTGDVTKIKKT